MFKRPAPTSTAYLLRRPDGKKVCERVERPRRHFRSRILLGATLTALFSTALAASAIEQARQRGKLSAGIHTIVPEYKAGMKFRTPEAIDTKLLEDVAKRLQLPLFPVRAEPGKQAALLKGGSVDIVLAAIPENDPIYRSATVIPTAYSAGPMAIMRTDTDIKTWEQLKSRKVCVSEGSLYVGTLAAKYGATEMIYKAPADALIAVRIGECDATVHDSAMLEELIKYPEWKKFSARLPVGPRTTLALFVPAEDKQGATLLKQIARDWASTAYADQLMKKAVRDIAFEVYLDQNVPDCH